MDKVVIAISGGVDSSVAALLLKQQGHEVAGITMRLAAAAGEGGTKCCGLREIEDARRVCKLLDIPHDVMDFSADLEERVVRPFLEEYERGRTPNPCVACNRDIKFGTLLEGSSGPGVRLYRHGPLCENREKGRNVFPQTFHLKRGRTRPIFCMRSGGSFLARIRFPLSDLTKEEVRRIARNNGLPVSEKEGKSGYLFHPGSGIWRIPQDPVD